MTVVDRPDALARVCAEWAAAQAVARLFHCLDAGDYPGVAELFADDGRWTRMGVELVGPDAVRKALEARPPRLVTRHLVTNLVVDAHGLCATARYYITVFDDADTAPGEVAALTAPGAIFVCEDQLVEADGSWRFASRRPVPTFKRSTAIGL